jgi:hypothetical protein
MCRFIIFLMFTFCFLVVCISIRDHYQHTYQALLPNKPIFLEFFFWWNFFFFYQFSASLSQLIQCAIVNLASCRFKIWILKFTRHFKRLNYFCEAIKSSTYFSWPTAPLFTCKLKHTKMKRKNYITATAGKVLVNFSKGSTKFFLPLKRKRNKLWETMTWIIEEIRIVKN